MRKWKAILVILAVLALSCVLGLGDSAAGAAPARSLELVHGRWFDGRGFVSRTVYAVDGRLTFRKPARIGSVLDLKGGYVVPPFGEAHNHNVEDSPRIAQVIRRYLEEGIFYVKNPCNLPRSRAPLAGRVNIPSSIDAVFANGGLTGSGGHPISLVQRNIARGTWTEADGEGAFYHAIDSRADLDRKWGAIRAGKPDFLKTLLLYSEEHGRRKGDPAFVGWRGLDPVLLPEIVRRAHRDGLRVSTHVESAADFHNALAAGVDEVNHLPGFRPERDDPRSYRDPARYAISAADARLAASRGVVVVPTVGGLLDFLEGGDPGLDPGLRKTAEGLVRRNLQLLQKHRVRLAIGSDEYGGTSLGEALSLRKLGIFDNHTLLKMWCETTAAAIFPQRRIGHLKEGYEASFLVLRGDPLQDFDDVRKIALRIKQGQVLEMAP